MSEGGVRKSARKNAGIRSNLDPSFVWPLELPNQAPTIPENEIVAKEVTNTHLEVEGKSSNGDVTQKGGSATSTKNSSEGFGTTISRKIDVEKKRIALEAEKAKAELMRQELESKMKIIEMQQKLAEAEIEEKLLSGSNDFDQEITGSSNGSVKSRTKRWVENCKYNLNESDSRSGLNKEKGNSDIEKLCHTISDAIKCVSGAQVISQEGLLSRQVVDKDFFIFDGKPEDWLMFYTNFNRKASLCHYSDEEKIVKLQRCLKGEALEAVRSLLLHPGNISTIFQTLELRFGRPEYIIKVLLNKAHSLPFVKEGDFTNLIKFSCHVNNLVATLEQLEASRYLENPMMCEEMVAKLPNSLKLLWGQIVMQKKGKVNLKDFAEWIKDLSSAASYVSTPSFTAFPSDKKSLNQRNIVMQTTNDLKNNSCIYCEGGDHEISTCSILKNDNVEQRWTKIMKLKACFRCLRQGHRKQFCKSKKSCTINNCKKRHHYLLHKGNTSENVPTALQPLSATVPSTEHNEHSNEPVERICIANKNSNVLLRILPVKLFGPTTVINTYALFDEGSTITLIESEIAEQLNLAGRSEPFCMQWANNIVVQNNDSNLVDLKISAPFDNAKKYKMSGVRTVKNLSLPSQTVTMEKFKRFLHLRGLPIDDMIDAKPTILIGQDNIHLSVARKVYQGRDQDSPIATKTNLGWVVHGRVDSESFQTSKFNFHICDCTGNEQINSLIKESFSTESFGVYSKNVKVNLAEKRALKILETTTKYFEQDNRYETGLLWKNDNIILPESKSMAYSRLLCVERKLIKDEAYLTEYCNKINDYVNKGYIRKLNPKEVEINNPKTWYLPHFGVVNPNKPGKLRLVFDAAAKSQGVSLNDHLLQGPDFLSSLPGILMRFRRFKFAFSGDIAEMFHQVRIREEDRCSQRFLWRSGNQNAPVDVYEVQVMTFGATCSPCSAQYVLKLNARQSGQFPHLVKDVEKNFYVDDYLDCCTTEEEAVSKIKQLIELHKIGGFRIVNWVSNSSFVHENYRNQEVLKDLSKGSVDRVLGMWWDTSLDLFTFRLSFRTVSEDVVSGTNKPTKRQVLKLVMSIFDPLGMVTWLTIKGRMILQLIWRSGISWDDLIPDSIFQIWLRWLNELKSISSLEVPRCYSPIMSCAERIELNIFCDASEDAFASIAFLRVIYEDHVNVSFLSARARVSPLKPISIPRMELQSCVLGTRLLKVILDEIDIKIDRTLLWSDSKTVLHWIRGDGKNYKQFVAHRVGEIQETTEIDQWRFVPSELNIADQCTRLNSIVNRATWFEGPQFLYGPEETWPKNDISENYDFSDNERKASTKYINVITDQINAITPDVTRFSKWRRYVRTTAWVTRFVNRLKGEHFPANISVKEYEEAELKCLLRSQEESFFEEIYQLKSKASVDKSSRLSALSPFLGPDNLIRMHSRLTNATHLDTSVREPIILDPKNAIVQLVLRFYHEKLQHQGQNQVLNELRQRFWVINGRNAVRKVFRNCNFCKKRNALPSYPKMGNLPAIRLTPDVKPFTHTGIDYFGPLQVSVGRRREKRWGVLFTCLNVRAIHLEIAHSLNIDATIMAIRRMIARRGPIKHIYSDNGTNFRGASEELKKLYKSKGCFENELIPKLTEMEIEWHWIPPYSPFMGGCWERLIRSVKKILDVTLKHEAPGDEILYTLFTEAEYIVNSRPITHLSNDPTDPDCLTPNHLLISSCPVSLTPFPKTFEDEDFRRHWKKSQRLADIFWRRWTKEYLPTLSKRNKWTQDGKPIAVGDVVIEVDKNVPRKMWPLARIENVYPGQDGVVRVVDIKKRNGVFRRPVSGLARIFEKSEN